MCNNFPNIRITEGNNFSLVLPLRSRTYVATKPIDEDIDPEQLENVVVTFGGVEYHAQRTAQGVQIDLPATLAVGTYNILLTADYLESSIRAAYESAVTIVPWSAQSTAEQYIAGSPIVMRAAYVLSCVLTDAELEALKEEWREKIAEAEQAKEEAEQARREWEQKAADLDGVAQEQTLSQGVSDIRADISHIDIDATDLAKQGTNASATLTDTQTAAQQAAQNTAQLGAINSELASGKQDIVNALNDRGGNSSMSESLGDLAQDIRSSLALIGNGSVFTSEPTDFGDAFQKLLYLKTDSSGILGTRESVQFANIKYFFPNCRGVEARNITQLGNNVFTNSTLYFCITPVADHIGDGGYAPMNIGTWRRLQYPYSQMYKYTFNIYQDNLYWFQFGKDGDIFSSSINLQYWRANNSGSIVSNSLLTKEYWDDPNEPTETFVVNRDKLLWYFRNKFMPCFADRSSLSTQATITFADNLYNIITAEQDIVDYFTNRNWTLASA